MKQNPKIALCAAFSAGYEITKFIMQFPYEIELVITCHKDDTDYENKITELCKKSNTDIIRKRNANDDDIISEIKKRDIDIVILAWWPDIIKQDAISVANIGWLNMHPSLLPFNRGKHGYYWNIIEDTPFGVSLHLIDKNIDAGKLLFQKEIPVLIEDTGEKLYKKSFDEIIKLFKDSFRNLINGEYKPEILDNKKGTYHSSKEIELHSKINLDKSYNAKELINIIRARTFSNGPSANFEYEGKNYYVRLQIEEVIK